MSVDELLRAVEALCADLGLELDDVELRPGTVQVTVDRRDGGLDLEELAAASRAISAFLDEHDELAPTGRYELEVSSPGLERRLRRAEQFARAVGTRIVVRTQPGTAGERRAEGTLTAADAEGFTLVGDGGEERRFAYGDVERARTVFDWQGELAARRAEERSAKQPGGRPRTQAMDDNAPEGASAPSGDEGNSARERAARS